MDNLFNIVNNSTTNSTIPSSTTTSNNPPFEAVLSGYEWSVPTNRVITFSFYENDVFNGSYYGFETGVKEVSNAVKNNVRAIFGWLENVIDIDFQEVTEINTSTIGQIRFMDSNTPSYAYAYSPGGSGLGTAGDVHLKSSYDRLGDTNGFQNIAGKHGYLSIIHELGHALGLQHTHDGGLDAALDNTDNSVMTYNFTGNSAGTYMPLDIKALQDLYGAKAYNTGDNTYVFTTSIDKFTVNGVSLLNTTNLTKQALWDSGGIDTLDFSGLTYKSGGYQMDLKPGGLLSETFSTTTSYTTAIAYDVTIENVINSSSNDKIYLNSGANTISGYLTNKGTGSDVIYDGNSQDTLKLDYASAAVTKTQSGQDLILGLGGNGSIKLVNYYSDPSNQIKILYSDSTTTTTTTPLVITNTELSLVINGTTETGSLQSYGAASINNGNSMPQDTTQAIVTYSSDKSEVQIDNNGWKQFSLGNYNITANTVLTFDFRSTKEGEIQGIGFDNNDDVFDNTNTLFQLNGIQTWGNQAFNNYTAADGWKTYTIKVGDYFTGNYDRLAFMNDDDRSTPNASSQFGNINIYEANNTNTNSVNITVNGTTETGSLQSYGAASINNGNSAPQDTTQAIVTYSSNIHEVQIDNNGWKKFDIGNYNITANTVLTFEFRSTKEGEIQGIGFDNNDDVFDNTNTLFQLHGIQTWGNQAFNNYTAADGWKSYSIKVGDYFTGNYDSLAFMNDDDRSTPNASSQFRNINIYDANTTNTTNTTNTDSVNITVNGNTQTDSLQSYGAASILNGTSLPQDTTQAIVTYSSDKSEVQIDNNGWKKFDIGNYNITANTVLTFEFRSTKEGEIQGIGFDNNDDVFDNTNTLFQLHGIQTWGNQAFNNYTAADGWKSYSIKVGDYFTGNYDSLAFMNDDDRSTPNASSQFRNINIQETTSNTVPANSLPSNTNIFSKPSGQNIISQVLSNTGIDLTGVKKDQQLVGQQVMVKHEMGTKGEDTFILGDELQSYYDQAGYKDFAMIKGFNTQQGDTIQLHGDQSLYDVVSFGKGDYQASAIFSKAGNTDDLIGIVSGVNSLDLNSSAFNFV
ncbi:M10 family metallopeptidase [Crocosphaera sp. UHCC 0190]|uniref:M10 family metallopeptidase n=1 Tax=Crocosphaera sp. UHCC 0190 TaxID=3110246 RepID=UPI002B21B387|nr:M10 family metallopeptidase [Crocosphaera sp. UHCC 0190]MEA5508590.1 M10 family metallopeptidase [Crocosphaera sp. UHCC 0190]